MFRDREDAGGRLGAAVADRGWTDVVVLGLPRGGIPVAAAVADALDAPLDAFVVRKLGLPGHEELAMGAIATGGVVVRNDDVLRFHRVDPAAIEQVAARERAELERREAAYRGDRPPLSLGGKTVVLVDDGLATGSTMRAAARAAIRHSPPPARVVVAVPVGAQRTCRSLAEEPGVEEVVCLESPPDFYAVGEWYEDFTQTTDEEVRSLLLGGFSGPMAQRNHPEA